MACWVDVHAHLDSVKDAPAALARAHAQGVRHVVTASVDAASVEASLALARRFDGVHAAVGLHPVNLLALPEGGEAGALAGVEDALGEAVAVGEVGLDYKHADTPQKRRRQQAVFEAQLALAERHGKPVVVHARGSQREVLETLASFTPPRVLLHWFLTGKRGVRVIADRGYFVSAGPNVVFEPGLRGYLRSLPLSALTLETDAPVPFRGEPTDPSWVPRAGRALARVLGVRQAEVARRTTANAARLFGWKQKD